MFDQNPPNSRRDFLKKAAVAATAFYIVPRHVLGKGYLAPSDKLNVGGIGCGGKGRVDLNGVWNNGSENIAALCDVDDRQVAWAREKWPRPSFTKITARCSTPRKTSTP